MWTEKQALGLETVLDRISKDTAPHKAYIGFRYVSPLTAETLEQMKRDGVERAIAFSLYPQYSCSTTGSSLNELVKSLPKIDPEKSIKWSLIDRWPTHQGLINTYINHIKSKLQEYEKHERDDVVLLFSAHSLPMSVVNRGDAYPGEVAASVDRIMSQMNLRNPYKITWQSQVGPAPW